MNAKRTAKFPFVQFSLFRKQFIIPVHVIGVVSNLLFYTQQSYRKNQPFSLRTPHRQKFTLRVQKREK
jgi:hypothetical protein